MTTSVTLRYVDCDLALATPHSFISRLVSVSTERSVRVVTTSSAPVDLQFTSVQIPLMRKARLESARVLRRWQPGKRQRRDPRWTVANPEPRGEARAHVWFTGENLRPPLGSWDGYLSFDTDPLGGKNAYLPLWWYSAGLLGPASSIFLSGMPSWEGMLQAREPGPVRQKFACAFINNPEPMRLQAIRILSHVGAVDVFGAAVGRPVLDKAVVARNYRFTVCFENDLYPGYVTEKPFEAWATGAVPLWRGSDPAGYLNPDAIINAADTPSLEGFAEAVARVEADPAMWQYMASQPILARAPDLTAARNLMLRVLA